ncbi:MAG: SGNH/GDSL hydrolase family protein [Gammaproteobacteria bacterium]|nr:SGNH/GDSL hydrolase family protein [Gammaproteobacteria bacterium]
MQVLLGFLGLLLAFLAAPLQAAPVYTELVVFGASLNTSGNGGPAAETPPYSPGRWSNGTVAAEYLAGGLGLGLSASSVGGNNYAVGGANTAAIRSQGGAYLGKVGGTANADALYLIWAGGVDLGQGINPAVSAGNITGLITDLQSAGARNFLFLNLYDLGFSPNGIGSPSPGIAASNQAYATALSNLRAGLDIKLMELDVFGLFNQIRAAPGDYGLSNVSNACYDGLIFGGGTRAQCADPDSYFWWDTAHPTSAGHAIIGQAALTTVVPVPPGALLLSTALLAGFGWTRRRITA